MLDTFVAVTLYLLIVLFLKNTVFKARVTFPTVTLPGAEEIPSLFASKYQMYYTEICLDLLKRSRYGPVFSWSSPHSGDC